MVEAVHNRTVAELRPVPSPACDPHAGEAGFSLLETLVALALLSTISLITYGATLQFTGISARADARLGQIVDGHGARTALQTLASAARPDSRTPFEGSPTAFSATVLDRSGGVQGGRWIVRMGEDGIYAGPANDPSGGADTAPALGRIVELSRPGRFAYLGTDMRWRESWPPESPIPYRAGVDADNPTADFRFGDIPKLPLAVRVTVPEGPSFLATFDAADVEVTTPDAGLEGGT